MSRSTKAMGLGLICCASAILACDSSTPTQPASSTAIDLAQAPVEVPLFEQFQDVNPCTGQIVTYTFTGTARIRDTGGRFLLVASGTVSTSDGFTGRFNRQFIINDHVSHFRFHDSEASDATGQRIIFGVGLSHQTTANGRTVVAFEHFSGLRCVGRG